MLQGRSTRGMRKGKKKMLVEKMNRKILSTKWNNFGAYVSGEYFLNFNLILFCTAVI